MPYMTQHVDCTAPMVRLHNGYTTLAWESGLNLQFDSDEWRALIAAIHAATGAAFGPIK